MDENRRFFCLRGAKSAVICDASFPRHTDQNFRFFGTSGSPKFCTFFGLFGTWFFGLRTASRPDFRTWPKSRFLALWLSGWRFWQVLYGSLQMAKKSTFLRFLRFLRFFRFFAIFSIFRDFPDFRTFPEICRKYDFWHLKTRLFELLKFQDFGTFWISFRHVSIWDFVCWYVHIFLSFLATKKLKKYITLATTTLVTAG